MIDWFCKSTWKVSAQNTVVCLIGCMSGDYLALYLMLDVFHTPLPMLVIVAIAIVCGLFTSILLETLVLLRQMPFKKAVVTAFGMSFFSMVLMEVVANTISLSLGHGDRLLWWVIVAGISAGFLAAWPYNYYRLKLYGKACH